MDRKIVELISFPDFYQGEMAFGVLRSAGIECTIAKEGANPLQHLGAVSFMGVKILVFEEDVERALAILDAEYDNQEMAQV